jgi:hypothetical protein
MHALPLPWIGGRSVCFFRLACEEEYLVVGTDLPIFGEYQFSQDGKSAASMAFPSQSIRAVMPGITSNNEWKCQGVKGVAAGGIDAVCYAQFASPGESVAFMVSANSSQAAPNVAFVLTRSTTQPVFKLFELSRTEL